MAAIPLSAVKVVSSNGTISLGKEFAGRQVLVEVKEPGVWLVRTSTVIPDNELWLHTAKAQADVSQALQWALKHPSDASSTDDVLARLKDGS